ncbi:MAG: DUF1292 domain-containing protein [Oscillospiraceae bacterium]|nr:DUF1292 domain-containing protein [Oscillospiraceae bacterium]
MSEEYNPDLVTVMDDDGNEHIFEELDRIETDTARYVALLPYFENAEEMLEDDGEIIVLKVTEEDGETYLVQIEDDDEYEEISAIFEERLAELFNGEDEDDILS